MGRAAVLFVVNPIRWPLIAVLLLAACSPPVVVSPSPTGLVSPTPSIMKGPPPTPPPTPTAEPTPNHSTPLSLSAIQRLNPRVGYIAGWNGTGLGLAKTSDGGGTWRRIPIPVDYLTSLRFIDERVGWAGGFATRNAVGGIACQQAAPIGSQPCKGVVLRTQDGGQTWQTVLAIPTDGILGEPIRQIQAVDGQRAWALTLDQALCQSPCLSYLQSTIDGGQTWTKQVHAEISAIRFASASRGWIALDDTPTAGTVEVRETSDGGTTWRTVLRTVTGNALGLDAATISIAWLLTRDGAYCSSSGCQKYALFRTDNGGLTWASLGNPQDFTANCSGGLLGAPLFASPGRGWLGLGLGAGGANVGPGGILKSEDGGRTWHCATTPPNTSMISAADPLHVWAGGEDRSTQSSALYTTEDAGATWHRLDLSSLR
jgi:photosystem II stability/assembly factor-like uncharacterized protein